jgi:hypothetical protein
MYIHACIQTYIYTEDLYIYIHIGRYLTHIYIYVHVYTHIYIYGFIVHYLLEGYLKLEESMYPGTISTWTNRSGLA